MMKNALKKSLSVIIALTLLLGAAPLGGFAGSDSLSQGIFNLSAYAFTDHAEDIEYAENKLNYYNSRYMRYDYNSSGGEVISTPYVTAKFCAGSYYMLRAIAAELNTAGKYDKEIQAAEDKLNFYNNRYIGSDYNASGGEAISTPYVTAKFCAGSYYMLRAIAAELNKAGRFDKEIKYAEDKLNFYNNRYIGSDYNASGGEVISTPYVTAKFCAGSYYMLWAIAAELNKAGRYDKEIKYAEDKLNLYNSRYIGSDYNASGGEVVSTPYVTAKFCAGSYYMLRAIAAEQNTAGKYDTEIKAAEDKLDRYNSRYIGSDYNASGGEVVSTPYVTAKFCAGSYYMLKASAEILNDPETGGAGNVRSFFQRVWNWILKYLLFGWIWMK